MDDDVIQVVEHLSRKCKAQSSDPQYHQKKKNYQCHGEITKAL
jgi:hypothetical protein